MVKIVVDAFKKFDGIRKRFQIKLNSQKLKRSFESEN